MITAAAMSAPAVANSSRRRRQYRGNARRSPGWKMSRVVATGRAATLRAARKGLSRPGIFTLTRLHRSQLRGPWARVGWLHAFSCRPSRSAPRAPALRLAGADTPRELAGRHRHAYLGRQLAPERYRLGTLRCSRYIVDMAGWPVASTALPSISTHACPTRRESSRRTPLTNSGSRPSRVSSANNVSARGTQCFSLGPIRPMAPSVPRRRSSTDGDLRPVRRGRRSWAAMSSCTSGVRLVSHLARMSHGSARATRRMVLGRGRVDTT